MADVTYNISGTVQKGGCSVLPQQGLGRVKRARHIYFAGQGGVVGSGCFPFAGNQ